MLPDFIELEVGEGVEKMPFDMFVRWACLVESIEFITDKCIQLGLDVADDSWIKPNAIEKYVDERTPAMHHMLSRELK